MRRTLLLTIGLISMCLASTPYAAAQPSQEAMALLQVVEMRVHVTHAPIYAAPRRNAEVVHTLAWNERILALAQMGKFYRVILPDGGPQGYVLGTQLRPTSHPLHQSQVPPDLRRQRHYVGARFDLYGGIVVPHRSEQLVDGFRPGLDVGARLSYPIAGPLGIAVRMSYRQFGESHGSEGPLQPRNIDVRGRALSVFTGAVGMDLTAFRGHWIAFVGAVDGGLYHVTVDDAVAAAHNPFGSPSSIAWGGSASLRVSLRLGPVVRFFLEPSYEVIQTPSETAHLVPARIGFSFER